MLTELERVPYTPQKVFKNLTSTSTPTYTLPYDALLLFPSGFGGLQEKSSSFKPSPPPATTRSEVRHTNWNAASLTLSPRPPGDAWKPSPTWLLQVRSPGAGAKRGQGAGQPQEGRGLVLWGMSQGRD